MSWNIFTLRKGKPGFYFLPFYENSIIFSEENTIQVQHDLKKKIILPDGVTQVFGVKKSCFVLEK